MKGGAAHAYGQGFREGALWAASLARDVLKGLAPESDPGGFNGRSYRSAVRALQAIADGIEQGIEGRPPPEFSFTISPPPKGPPSWDALAAQTEADRAATAHLRAPPKAMVAEAAGGPPIFEGHATDAHEIAPDRAYRAVAIAKGYTGDECRDCGSFSMVRNGTCLKCENCGSTTGCS